MGSPLDHELLRLEKRVRWYEPERLLSLGSALLLVSNALLLFVVFLNFTGSLGGWDASKTLWVALGMDLVGVAMLGRVFLAIARRADGRSRRYRAIAGFLLLAWTALSLFWRFFLPALMGTNVQDLFFTMTTSQGALPARISLYAPIVDQILVAWTASAALFVAAHAVILLDVRIAARDDWARGLPVYAWILAATVSFLATISIVVSLSLVLRGGQLGDSFGASALVKLVVAPNIFISGYASSLQLGREIARTASPPTEG